MTGLWGLLCKIGDFLVELLRAFMGWRWWIVRASALALGWSVGAAVTSAENVSSFLGRMRDFAVSILGPDGHVPVAIDTLESGISTISPYLSFGNAILPVSETITCMSIYLATYVVWAGMKLVLTVLRLRISSLSLLLGTKTGAH